MYDEKRLARRLQQGDARAFTEFVDQYGGRVHSLVRRYVDNPADGEDITQEIFCDLHRGIKTFRGESSLATWVYRVTLNHCLKHCRKRRSDNISLDRMQETGIEGVLPRGEWRDDPARSAARSELSDQVHDALGKLSPLHADVVVLCELHGLTYQECAATLGIPVGTVKSRMSTAFQRLRNLLSSYVIGDQTIPLSKQSLSTRSHSTQSHSIQSHSIQSKDRSKEQPKEKVQEAAQ